MGSHVGTWIYSDTVKTLEFSCVQPDGTAFTLTDYAVYVELRVPGATTLAATVTGSVVSGALGTGRAYLGNVVALQPAVAGASQQYECFVKAVNGSDVAYFGKGTDGGDPFTITVRRWP
jgi:hypothetical protein